MGRRNVLVEGVSGSGKSSVCRELRRRGHDAVDGDRELAYQGDPVTGRVVDGVTGTDVHRHHLWDVGRVRALVADDATPVTFFCGGSRNVGAFIDLFDTVFVLTIDLDTLRSRLDQRAADDWAGRGRTAERAMVEELHASGADTPAGTPVDATRPLHVVVDEILRRC
ncbi:nucleoside kinase [Curtobacterium sp. MCLR17_007]|uniref:AAA family ATPase n=1 Tax=Curtobacterium sp. MCLR17_007 TaxID=2175648 RepID=UPI000DA7074C|nr:AAA family ATPase [Curtobacterium sp. MCLR17_007]WIB60164.1 nucleoside kinase [Curtobacterium sp. MCLR17_007]